MEKMENNYNMDLRQVLIQQQYNYSQLKAYRDQLEEQLQIFETSLTTFQFMKSTLENLKTINVNDEILVPVGPLINIKAQIKDVEKVLVRISEDVVMEKKLDDAIAFLENSIQQQEEQAKKFNEQFQQAELDLQNLTQNLQNLLQQMQP